SFGLVKTSKPSELSEPARSLTSMAIYLSRAGELLAASYLLPFSLYVRGDELALTACTTTVMMKISGVTSKMRRLYN
ncbi:hypothetical protein TUN199_12173, partial [Pyrenophora tritici-repentis]